MIRHYTEISIAHSTAISLLADRVEVEARRGSRIEDVLHLVARAGSGEMGCIHVGQRIAFVAGRRGGKTYLMNLTWHPTPFGMCNSPLVAAELNVRRALANSTLAWAREQGHDKPYLHVWEPKP